MELSKLSKIDKKELLNEIKNMNFSYRDKLNFSNNITFGVEIEYGTAKRSNIMDVMECYSGEKIDDFYKYWQYGLEMAFSKVIHGEYYGGELISPILKNKKEYYNQLKLACHTLKKFGATTSGLMAQHVHISTKPFKSKLRYFENFIKIYMLYEDLIYTFGFYGKEPRKVITTYANPISYLLYNALLEESYNNYEELMSLCDFYFGKTSSINYDKFSKTLEFRSCNSTINPVIIQNNINLFCSLIEASKNKKIDLDLIDYKLEKFKEAKYFTSKVSKDLNRAFELSDLIFRKDIDKKYFLKQYMM